MFLQDNLNGYTCTCTEDYTGFSCDSPAHICAFSPCENDGTCIVSKSLHPYAYMYTTNIIVLTVYAIKRCKAVYMLCSNFKILQVTDTGFNCSCTAGYKGVLCGTTITQCDSNPCMHEGICFVSTCRSFSIATLAA